MSELNLSEISHRSLVETQRTDEQLSLRLETVEAQTTIPHLSEQDKMRVMQMMADDLDRVNNGEAGFGGIVHEVWSATANITSNTEWHKRKFSEKHMAAMKLYAAGLFCELFDREKAGKDVDILSIGEAYFSSSDLITDHVGGYDSSLELFSLSRQSEAGRRQGSSIVAGLIYDGTYYRHISEDLSQAWQAQGAVEGQLNMLTALDYLQKAAIGEIYPTETMQKAILTMMGSIADDPKSSPFVARVAGVMIDNIKEEANVEWVYLDELPSEEAEQIMRLHAERQKEFLKEQEELHKAFPDFPHDAYLYRIAKDACVQLDQGELGKLITISAEKANLHRPWDESVSGLCDKDMRLLKEAHQPRVLDSIGLESGLDMRSLPLGAQARFFRFMAESDGRSYGRLVAALSRLEGQREVFAEAFLATEFGDDYGDAILDIAEHAERHQAMHIFETVNTLRVRTGEFAEMFKAIDPKFAHATEKAFNERITDALTALQEVAVKGNLHQDVAPHQKKADYVHDGRFDIAVHSIEEATEIIDGLEKTFGTMHKITTAEDLKITKVNSDETQFVMYRLAGQSAGNMLIYIRPEGAYGHDKQMEYGNRQGVEASISFMVDPLNPHKLLLPKDPDAVSIRFDHEGRLVDEAPNSERRDPTRRDGLISADLSSGMGSASSLAVKIGRFVAAGNRIRANRRGTEDSLHHNTNYFDQEKYGDADGFAHLARSVIRQIELMKKILRSKKIGMAAHVATKATGSEQVDLPKAA